MFLNKKFSTEKNTSIVFIYYLVYCSNVSDLFQNCLFVKNIKKHVFNLKNQKTKTKLIKLSDERSN